MKIIVVPWQKYLDIGVAKGSGGPRSKGLHMSDIYGAMLKDLHPERYENFKDDEAGLEMFGEGGFAVEHIIERGLKGRHAERPEEFQTPEGIYFSPDLLIYEHDTNRVRLGEIKAAWMSSREVPRKSTSSSFMSFPPKFDKYLYQIKAYCYHLGTPYACLIVYFVNGKYDCKNRAEELKPELHVWELEFSDIELREHWQMLLNYAKSKGMLDANGLVSEQWLRENGRAA
jgi:hypothetical protein